MGDGRAPRQDRKLDQAARAAWLYYVAGKTQDEIAHHLNVSRQAAQRLVSLAVAAKLIRFRLDHPLAEPMELAAALAARFGLAVCDVTPADPGSDDPTLSVAMAAADRLATYLAQRAPLVIAFTAGRTLRAMVREVPTVASPHHKLVSLTGVISRDGRADLFEVVRELAERTGAQCFPMPTPVIASSVQERRLFQAQPSYAVIRELARHAVAAFFGVGEVGWRAPVHRNGIVDDRELAQLVELGAVGEIAGWAFDAEGRPVEADTNKRVAGVPLDDVAGTRILVGGGPAKVPAIRAALRGRLARGLVTDERTARSVLEAEDHPAAANAGLDKKTPIELAPVVGAKAHRLDQGG